MINFNGRGLPSSSIMEIQNNSCFNIHGGIKPIFSPVPFGITSNYNLPIPRVENINFNPNTLEIPDSIGFGMINSNSISLKTTVEKIKETGKVVFEKDNKDITILIIDNGSSDCYIIPKEVMKNLDYFKMLVETLLGSNNIPFQLIEKNIVYVPNICIMSDCIPFVQISNVCTRIGEKFIFKNLELSDFIMTNIGLLFVNTDHLLIRILVNRVTLGFNSPTGNPLVQDFYNYFRDKNTLFTDSITGAKYSKDFISDLKILEKITEIVKTTIV